MNTDRDNFGCDIPYDFCAVQDKNLIEDSLWASAHKMNEYEGKLEQIYMAQLMTADSITGDKAYDYKLLKNAFDALLNNYEKQFEARQSQFERFNDELVKSASVRVAREVKLAIEAYREDESKKEAHFESMASALFVMENNQPLKADNENIPF